MGPVGMLCVQRTLNDGRKHGLITGLGAVVGDVIFAIITLIGTLGLGFILYYIEKHHAFLQIAGSIILIIFGYVVFRQNPARNLQKYTTTDHSYGKVFVSSLALTVSNIGVLFLYIALFARFNLVDPCNYGKTLMVIPSIAIGALLWWLFITYVVNKLRTIFNPRGLKVFNKIVGVILIVIGVVGFISGIYMKVYGEIAFSLF